MSRCKAHTLSGTVCKKNRCEDSLYCKIHKLSAPTSNISNTVSNIYGVLQSIEQPKLKYYGLYTSIADEKFPTLINALFKPETLLTVMASYPDEYIIPEDTYTQCTGITLKGTRCKRECINESKFCKLHKGPAEPVDDYPILSLYNIYKYTHFLIKQWCKSENDDIRYEKLYYYVTHTPNLETGFITLAKIVVDRIDTPLSFLAGYSDDYKIPVTDPYYNIIKQKKLAIKYNKFMKQLIEQEAREAAFRAVEAARVAEVARLAFIARDRAEPIIFRQDPEGGIDLRALGEDPQSIHRSSVQTSTEKAAHILLSRPLTKDQDTWKELHLYIKDSWLPEDIIRFHSDYLLTEAFSIKYGDVLDRVWSFINSSEHKTELLRRLQEETHGFFTLCSNGKMARLINVLRGFDSLLEDEAPAELPKTIFQERIARLKDAPIEEREAAAKILFEDFKIPNEEHAAWLEPLLN